MPGTVSAKYLVMFDFEKLDVCEKAKVFNSGLRELIKNTRLDSTTSNQLEEPLSALF